MFFSDTKYNWVDKNHILEIEYACIIIYIVLIIAFLSVKKITDNL